MYEFLHVSRPYRANRGGGGSQAVFSHLSGTILVKSHMTTKCFKHFIFILISIKISSLSPKQSLIRPGILIVFLYNLHFVFVISIVNSCNVHVFHFCIFSNKFDLFLHSKLSKLKLFSLYFFFLFHLIAKTSYQQTLIEKMSL